MADKGRIPINKRWPGKHAIRLKIWGPDGTSYIGVETELSEERVKQILAIIGEQLNCPEVQDDRAVE